MQRSSVCWPAVSLWAGPAARTTTRRDAVERAEAYLHAVSGGSADRGWSLLISADRERVYGDLEAYLELAEDVDWESFEWEPVSSRCDDGVCTLWFETPDAELIPEVLLRGPLRDQTDERTGANVAMTVLQRGPFDTGVSIPEH